MKFLVVATLIAVFAVAFSVSQPIGDPKDAQTIRYDSNVEPEQYNFAVETSDGKNHEEQGHVEDLGTDDEAISVKGSYSYIGDDGVTYTVNYVADRNGFQPQGAHIPVV